MGTRDAYAVPRANLAPSLPFARPRRDLGRLDVAGLAIVMRMQVRGRLHDELDDDPRGMGLVVDTERAQALCTCEVEDGGMKVPGVRVHVPDILRRCLVSRVASSLYVAGLAARLADHDRPPEQTVLASRDVVCSGHIGGAASAISALCIPVRTSRFAKRCGRRCELGKSPSHP